MLLWRKFEDKSAALYIQQKIRGFLHLYNGQEAVLAGCIEAIDPKKIGLLLHTETMCNQLHLELNLSTSWQKCLVKLLDVQKEMVAQCICLAKSIISLEDMVL